MDGILAEDQKMVSLWNALVREGEVSRKAWETVLKGDPVFREVNAQVEGLLAERKTLDDRWRRGREGKDSQDEELGAASPHAEVRVRLRKAFQALREARARIARENEGHSRKLVRERESRERSLWRGAVRGGLHWSFADSVLRRYRTAWIQALGGEKGFPTEKKECDPPMPFAFRYTHGGCPFRRLLSPRTRMLRLVVPEDEDPPEGLSRSARARWRKKRGRGEALVRIGEKTYRFGIVLHRRPAGDWIMKKAEISRAFRFHGRDGRASRWEWKLSVTLEVPPPPRAPEALPRGRAALALGWRRKGDSLRVGVLAPEGGEPEEVFLPAKILARDERARAVQIASDVDLKEVKALVRPHLDTVAAAAQDGAELAELRQSWTHVRAGGLLRLKGILERSGAPQEPLKTLADWERRRVRLLNIRRGLYRHLRQHRSWWWQNVMLEICRRFGEVVTLDLPLERLMRREAPERKIPARADAATTARQQMAGLHEAGRWLDLMAAKAGTAVRRVNGAFASRRCARCGGCEACGMPIELGGTSRHDCAGRDPGSFPAGFDSGFQCSRCGLECDRGMNTAMNLLGHP